RARLPAEQPHQLAVHELDEMLLRREAAQHLGPERVTLDRLDEVADDSDVHVGLEEREPHVAQRFLDVALGDPPLAPELAHQGIELLAQGIEHDDAASDREAVDAMSGGERCQETPAALPRALQTPDLARRAIARRGRRGREWRPSSSTSQ